MKTIYVFLLVSLNVLSPLSLAQTAKSQSIPDADLSVGARERENGKLGKAIYYFILKCRHGECELTTIRFRCEPYSVTSKDSSFRPEVWRSSTTGGTLTVNNLGSQLEVLETSSDFDGPTKGNLLFGFSLSNQTGIANKVRSFSGGWVMSIRPIKEVHTIEFVPLVGGDAFVQLECNTLWLPGIDTSK